ncbi:unnamed protein product [Closterium sp. Naga37s-1]|nr:unnamed protein product [Closterium sp. Naga37s-1]
MHLRSNLKSLPAPHRLAWLCPCTLTPPPSPCSPDPPARPVSPALFPPAPPALLPSCPPLHPPENVPRSAALQCGLPGASHTGHRVHPHCHTWLDARDVPSAAPAHPSLATYGPTQQPLQEMRASWSRECAVPREPAVPDEVDDAAMSADAASPAGEFSVLPQKPSVILI